MKIESLDGNRKLINLCKKNNLTLFNPKGEYNGYGYVKEPLAVQLNTEEEVKLFEELQQLIYSTSKKEKVVDKAAAWSRRLSKLTSYNL